MRTIRHITKVSTLTGVVLTSLFFSSHPVAAQKACVVTDSGNVVCGRLQQNSQKPSTVKNQTVEFEEINLTLQGCKRSSSTVNCHVLFTTKQDGLVYFSCRNETKMFDTYGKDYFCEQGQLGQNKDRYRAEARMLKGVPLKAIATFKEVPIQVKEIAALKIDVELIINGSVYRSAAFRSIPISE
jgi:hypothetical protein